MSTNLLLNFRPTGIQVCASSSSSSSSSSGQRKGEANRRKSSSSNWWAPIFGWSSEPDYIEDDNRKTEGRSEAKGSRSRFTPGCFTEEKAKQLRLMTKDTASFHDAMYHSAIASRLASDFNFNNRSDQ